MSRLMGFAGVPSVPSSSLDVAILMVDAVLRSKAALVEAPADFSCSLLALPPLALALLPLPPAAAPLIAVFAATLFAFAGFAAGKNSLSLCGAPRRPPLCAVLLICLIDFYSTLTPAPFARTTRARPLLAVAALAAPRPPPCLTQRNTTPHNATQRNTATPC